MEAFDTICKDRLVQKVNVKNVGKVIVKHHLVNCLHNDKERRGRGKGKTTAFLQRNITTLALEIIQQEASKGEGWRTSTPHTRFHSNLPLPPPIKKIEFYILLITIQNVQLLSTVTLALIAYGYNGGMPEDTLVTLVLHVSTIFIFTVVITALLSSHINCLQSVRLPQ